MKAPQFRKMIEAAGGQLVGPMGARLVYKMPSGELLSAPEGEGGVASSEVAMLQAKLGHQEVDDDPLADDIAAELELLARNEVDEPAVEHDAPGGKKRAVKCTTPNEQKRATGIESLDIAERAVRIESPALVARAEGPETPINGERAANTRTPGTQKRAEVPEPPVLDERAGMQAPPVRHERADTAETPVDEERAGRRNAPVLTERAVKRAPPVPGERADTYAAPDGDERAITQEPPVEYERADELEAPSELKRAVNQDPPVEYERAEGYETAESSARAAPPEAPVLKKRADAVAAPGAEKRAAVLEAPVTKKRAVASEPPEATERTREQHRLALKRKVRIFYDLQRMRMQVAGRTLERPTKPGEEEKVVIYLHEVDLAILENRANDLKVVERQALRDVEQHLRALPFYTHVLSDKSLFKGIGPTMAGVIMSEFDIHRADTVSKMWAFAGLHSTPAIRCRHCFTLLDPDTFKHRTKPSKECSDAGREFVTDVADQVASGASPRPTKGQKLPYNAWLRTKLVGVLGPVMLKVGSPWRKTYDDNKHRLESQGWGRNQGHRHQAAIRYMIKMMLLDVHKRWRAHEGLHVRPPYSEEKLHMPPHGGAAAGAA